MIDFTLDRSLCPKLSIAECGVIKLKNLLFQINFCSVCNTVVCVDIYYPKPSTVQFQSSHVFGSI